MEDRRRKDFLEGSLLTQGKELAQSWNSKRNAHQLWVAGQEVSAKGKQQEKGWNQQVTLVIWENSGKSACSNHAKRESKCSWWPWYMQQGMCKFCWITSVMLYPKSCWKNNLKGLVWMRQKMNFVMKKWFGMLCTYKEVCRTPLYTGQRVCVTSKCIKETEKEWLRSLFILTNNELRIELFIFTVGLNTSLPNRVSQDSINYFCCSFLAACRTNSVIVVVF